ncbi:MAG: hypothetical protein IPL52_17910 [Flavobacteriales bacterium]|nr:hypothetical protein [Flavobacteriales bacterium]
MRSIASIAVFLACAGVASPAARAQQAPPPQVAAEHYYYFACQGITSDYTEKVLTEALRGMDAEMVVSIDRPQQAMKLVARYPLNKQEVISTAAQYGVALADRRSGTAPETNTPRE